MIIGDCPYDGCTGSHMISIAPECPSFSKHKCEECGREFWLLHSRIAPYSYTLEGFAEQFVVDEEAREISRRDGELVVPVECHCMCHQPGTSAIHFVECCDGQCPKCHRWFKSLGVHQLNCNGILQPS